MAIQTLHDTGIDIPSKYDGGVYAVATTDCVIQGVGDEFAINYSSSNLNVTFNAGSQAIIGGAFFHITSNHVVELVANSTIYLCASIDLSLPDGNRGTFKLRTSSSMKQENINGNGIERDLLLYILTTDANGVTSVQDRRVIKSKPNTSWNDLTDRPDINNGTLTIQKNGTTIATFDANSNANVTANLSIPTRTSELTNNSDFATNASLNSKSASGINPNSRLYLLTSYVQDQSYSWTAPQKCWVFFSIHTYSHIWIDNVKVYSYESQGADAITMNSFIVTAGTNIRWINCNMKAYAVR